MKREGSHRTTRFFTALLSAHPFFKRSRRNREAEAVADEFHSVRAGGVQFAVRALGLDDEGSGLRSHHLAIALWVAKVDQQFDVARHVQIAAGDIDELHGALRPVW